MPQNTQITLATRPQGMPKTTDFGLQKNDVPALTDGQVLIEVEIVSLDPAIRGWMNAGTTYIPGIEIGAVIRAFAAGKVLASRHSNYASGEYVTGLLGAQKYAISDGQGLTKVDVSAGSLSYHLGILGMPGMTAYFGLLEKAKPAAGETVFVSGAAGIVGTTVGQIAKIKGCKVVGTAGSDEKCRFLTEKMGFDLAINYKTQDIDAVLKAQCPGKINVFFDNVGGDQLDIALNNLALGARVVICGAISQYNNTSALQGPKNYMKIVTARGIITGIIVFDYLEHYPRAVADIGGWLDAGLITTQEDFYDGLENFPQTLLKLYNGDNFGKLLLRI